jgi:hypothetical protein
MIDESKVKNFGRGEETSSTPTFSWSALPLETLLRYKLEIEACLPPTKLKDVDVESELVNQLRTAQRLQAKVLDYDEASIPLNQVVQAVNSVSAVIEKLAKLQIDLAETENLKKMEAAFIKAVQGLPTEAVEAFFSRYDRAADELGVQK